MTRAQEHLTLSLARTSDAGKDATECLFVSELQAAGIRGITCTVSTDVIAAARQQQLAPPPLPAPVPSPALLNRLLADFALSATTLNAYL